MWRYARLLFLARDKEVFAKLGNFFALAFMSIACQQAGVLSLCMLSCLAQNNVVIELNGLKIAEDRTFGDCARYMLTLLLSLGVPPPLRHAKDEYAALHAKGVGTLLIHAVSSCLDLSWLCVECRVSMILVQLASTVHKGEQGVVQCD